MKVRWTERAEHDLVAQCDYVALDNPGRAERIGAETIARIGRLAEHPYRGRSGRVERTRELPLPGLPWLAVYAVIDDAVVILRLLHGAQSWPPKEASSFFKDDFPG